MRKKEEEKKENVREEGECEEVGVRREKKEKKT